MKPEGIFRFGAFSISSRTRTLRRGEEVISLNRRAFDVLLYLVQNPGRVLGREELLENVWPDTLVEENSLAQSISVLRRALAEKPGDNNYIATLPGRGYQFISPVQVEIQESLAVASQEPLEAADSSGRILVQKQSIQTSIITEETTERRSPARKSRFRPALVAIVVLAAAVIAIAVWRRGHGARTAAQGIRIIPGSPSSRRSIAVLGFRNLSGRADEAWLSTALAEMLSTELVAGEKLRLVSGEDIARTKLELPLVDTDSLSRDTLSRLKKNLGSDLIVLGSYTILGEKPAIRIRLDLRLQDTAVGETVSDVAVIGNEADLFDVVSQAGSSLREKLGVESVSPADTLSVRASLPSNPIAIRLYSDGLARLRVFDALGARDLLHRAVTADPKFALAHSALAEAWFRSGYLKNAQQESRKAYDLSANLSREEKLAVEGRFREINHEYEEAIESYRALYKLFPDNIDYGLKLATVQIRGSKGHDALSTVESLRRLAQPISEDPRIDLKEAEAWNSLSDYKHQQSPLANAVQKARAQGARLILAEALEKQCSLFGYYLLQTQDAIAACRDSASLRAAAGDHADEAKALAVLGVIIMGTDAPESIRRFQQALSIFRKVGNQTAVAAIEMDLGMVYREQGDPAAAEKTEREALSVFRTLDDKRGEAKALGNIADARVDQGDLPGAIHLYEESMKADPEDLGRAIIARHNIGSVLELQGDIKGAQHSFEQSLAAWQDSDDHGGVADATLSLARVLMLEGDFSGARKNYERVLSSRTSSGEKLAVAEIQSALADLSLEEGRSPVEQEAAIRQVIAVFRHQQAHDDEAQGWCMLARALLAEGRDAAAKDAVQHAQGLGAKSQNPDVRWRTSITASRIATTNERSAHSRAGLAARKELALIIAESHRRGYGIVELDARFALAEIEIKAGQTVQGRSRLAAIQEEGKAKGYNLLVRKAAAVSG